MQKYGGVQILMSNVEYLIGDENTINLPMQTYSEEICDFLNSISQEILKSPHSRIYPDLSALAFWCRKGNIQKLKNAFCDKENRLGLGLCFHIAPSNIPINFAFSYFFSLLAGNANIVRLPSKNFPQIEVVIEIFKKVLVDFPQIEKRTAFVKYERNDGITSDFCKKADARMIWGGDRTISTVKNLESKPRCVDIAFSDRYSVCILNGEKIAKADDATIKKLSEDFYNDTYLMDQNACSSPQLIYWLNDKTEARKKFWDAVYETAEAKYNLQDAVCVDKYTKMCEDAVDFDIIKSTSQNGNLLYRSEIKQLSPEMEKIRGKGGYFYEYALDNVEEFFNIVTEKYQTVTYFGIDPQKLADEIISHNLRGIDRVVPVGKAMDIDVVWDGHDLVCELSRKISVV